jgi:hypothetical protein
LITHRFSLTTLDNDIADHRTFSYQQKNVYGKIRDFEKKIDYDAQNSEEFATLDETQDFESLTNLVRTFTKGTKLKKKSAQTVDEQRNFKANPPQI